MLVAVDLNVDHVGGNGRLELIGRALLDDFASVEDGDLVAELVGLFEVLGGEEEGDAVLAVESLDVVPEVLPGDGVESGGRFVEEDDRGGVDEGGGEIEAALHAAGVAADASVGVLGQVDDVEQMGDSVFDVASGDVVEAGLEAKELATGLEDVESGFLKGDPDGSADLSVLVEDVESGDPGLAGGGPEQGGQHADGGRLAAAVLSEETEDLSGTDTEIDAVDGLDLAEVLDQAVSLDGEVAVTGVLRGGGSEVLPETFGDGGGVIGRVIGHRCERIDSVGRLVEERQVVYARRSPPLPAASPPAARGEREGRRQCQTGRKTGIG